MLQRFSSRQQKLSSSLLNVNLAGARQYDRIAGYFATSLFDISGESLDQVEGTVRIICNAHLQVDDVRSIKAYEAALRQDWCESSPEQKPIEHPERLERLYTLLKSGKLEVKVLPDEVIGFLHGKAGVITRADGSKTSFLGSMNESQSGWERNYELVWQDDSEESVAWVQAEFDALWHNEHARPLIDFVVNDIQRIAERKIVYSIEMIEKPEESVVESPVYRRGLGLWEHQKYFVDLVYRAQRAGTKARYVLADMVGLGKTIQLGLGAQMLSLYSDKPVLIICPKTLVWQWQDELRELMGLPSAVWDGRCWVDEHGNSTGGHSAYDVKKCPRKIGIISQGIITANTDAANHLLHMSFNTVIVDECHRARRKNLDPKKQNEPPVPNNLYRYLMKISEKTEHMLMGTATPIQLLPIEAWDLLNILAQGDDTVLGSLASMWRSNPESGLDLLSGKYRANDPRSAWTWMRNPLPQSFSSPAFKTIREYLDLQESDYMANTTYDQLPPHVRVHVEQVAYDYAALHNPFITRIVRRTRKYLEDTVNPATGEPYLQKIAVELLGEGNEDAIRLPAYLRGAYEKAEEIAKELGQKNSGFITTMILRRVGSSMYAGKTTAEKMLGNANKPEELASSLLEDESFDDDEESTPKKALEVTEGAKSALRGFIDILTDNLESDPKYLKLEQLLLNEGWARKGCIIFSQYYDTVWWLAEKMVRSGKFADQKIAIYAGGDKSGMFIDGEFVRRPKEDLKRMVKTGELKIIFGTDAASEGLNLQTLGTLINIDLPWNPTRLEQRKGRIQRIGQKFDVIQIYNMRYAGSVEDKVHKVLAERLKYFNEIFGQVPDTLEAVWTMVAKDQIEQAKKTINEVPPKSPFEEKYENPKMANAYNWEECNKVLDEFIKIEHFMQKW